MLLTLILALVLLLAAATVLFLALVVSRRSRRALENRVDLVFAAAKGEEDPAFAPAKDPPPLTLTGERLRGIFAVWIAHRWGMRADAAKLLLLAGVALIVFWLAAAWLLHLPYGLAALAGFAASFVLPRLVLLREQGRAEKQFTNFFPDAIDMGGRMLRAGLPISSAIRTIGAEAPPPVNGVFKSLGDQLDIGIPFEEALAATAERVGLPDFRFFSVAVGLQRATGGNLATTLEILSDIMRKRRAVGLKAQATTAEVRVSAYILGSMPFFVTAVLLLVQPAYLTPLLTDPRGKFIVGAAIVSLLMGFLIMRRMMERAVRV